MRTEVKSGKTIYAIIFDLSSLKEGTFPVTDPKWPLQLLLMKRKRGHVVTKHMHKKILKSSRHPQEAIVVIKGDIEASIFDRKGVFIAKKKVGAGECILIVEGAHEVKITKDALVYAFKDGPYKDDKIPL